MIIQLSPFVPAVAVEITATVAGDVITINGEAFDFSPLTEGSELPPGAVRSEHICGPVKRESGVIILTLRFPIDADASQAARFPQPVSVASGRVEFPA